MDKFIATSRQADALPQQAVEILGLIRKAGKRGITRETLVKQVGQTVLTRQTPARLVSYYVPSLKHQRLIRAA